MVNTSEMHQGSKRNLRDTIIAPESDDDSTQRAESDTEEHAFELPERDGAVGDDDDDDDDDDDEYNETIGSDSVFESLSENIAEGDPDGEKQRIIHAAIPQIRAELYEEREPRVEVKHGFPLKEVNSFHELDQGNTQDTGLVYPDFPYQEDKGLASCSSHSDSLVSPSPSQHSLDANSLTTSGFSEAHSEQISSTDLHDEQTYLSLGNDESSLLPKDHWRSQSDPSGRTNGNGAPLLETIAEAERATAHRTSNSEPNLSAEKLKKEAAQLAKRINASVIPAPRSQSSPEGLSKFIHSDSQANEKDIDKERTIAEVSPDECFELDKPESPVRPVLKRTKSPPTPLTPPVRPKFQNSFANEKAQMKLNKLTAMEPIYEMPQGEPTIPVSDAVTPERKRSMQHGVIGLTESPVRKESLGRKEEKRRTSGAGQQEGKPSKTKHVSTRLLFRKVP